MVKIYQNIIPNNENNTHYFYLNVNNYLDFLERYKVAEIEENDYRMNNGILIISSSTQGAIYYRNFTYIYETFRTETGTLVTNFYHIIDVYMQSDNIYIKVELDYFAKYINYAEFNNIVVNRSNRLISNFGVYDNVKGGKDDALIYRLDNTNYDLTQVCAVIELEYNISQNIFGGNNISKTSLFAIPFQAIYDKVHSVSATYDNVDICEKVLDVIGGIYAVTSGTVVDIKAQVLNLWFIPTECVAFGSVGLKGIKTKSILTNMTDIVFDDVLELRPNHYIKRVSLDYISNLSWDTVCPNYHVEVGSYYNTMPVNRFIGASYVYYHFVTKASKMEVYIQHGNLEKDLTESFEVLMTTNNGTQSIFQNFTKGFVDTVKLIPSVMATRQEKGTSAAIMAGATGLISNIPSLQEGNLIGTRGKGDGAATFSLHTPLACRKPYFATLIRSIVNEKELANRYGANFNEKVNSFVDVFGLPLIQSGSTSDTYIKCDCEVSHVPLNVADFFRQKLADGIYYRYL